MEKVGEDMYFQTCLPDLISRYEFGLLALVAWRESRGEPPEAQAGVVYSVLNRVEHPKWWGTDLSSVIGKKWQYSSMAAPGDPQLIKYPLSDDQSWKDILVITAKCLAKRLVNPCKGADSYFDISIKPPKWATKDMFVRQIGRLRFYNVDRDYEAETLSSEEK